MLKVIDGQIYEIRKVQQVPKDGSFYIYLPADFCYAAGLKKGMELALTLEQEDHNIILKIRTVEVSLWLSYHP